MEEIFEVVLEVILELAANLVEMICGTYISHK